MPDFFTTNDGKRWATVRSICNDLRVDYARKREKLLESHIPREKLKAPGHNKRHYMMWCTPDTEIKEFEKLAKT